MLTTGRPPADGEYKRILTALYDLAGQGAAIDLGCGEAHITKDWPMCSLVDLVLRPAVLAAGRVVEQIDIRSVPAWFKRDQRKVNLAIMTDVIEHLTKADGAALIAGMQPFCNAIAIFTPIGPYKVNESATDPDTHKSGWTPEEMEAAGWSVWSWPKFHPMPDGSTVGAFWAWKFRDETPLPQAVAHRAEIRP